MRDRKKAVWAIGVVTVGVMAILIFAASRSSNQTNQQSLTHANAVTDAPAIGQPAPNATFTAVDGKTHTLAEYKGQKVMLWLFATWCPSCKAGMQALQANKGALGNLKIISVKTYGNAGYPGPTVKTFIESVSPKLLTEPAMAWGSLSEKATSVYNPKNYPDIYYLIDKNGIIRAISGSPSATLSTITQFAND